jgi:hypothetical protein
MYTEYVVNQVSSKDELESDQLRIRSDEINFVKQQLRQRTRDVKDQTNLSADLTRVCTAYIERCYNTIEFLMKEYLSEELYTLEYDKIFLEKDFEGKLVDKLYYLLDKVRSLIFLRDTIIPFLGKIDSREVSFNLLYYFRKFLLT